MTDLNALSLDALYAHLAETGLVRRLIALAHEEDLGVTPQASQPPLDITSLLTIPEGLSMRTVIAARQPFILAGVRTIPAILQAFAPEVAFEGRAADGQAVERGQPIGYLTGPARQILAAERTILNMLGRLSGVATLAHRYVDAVAGTRAKILDTRKTTPGLRVLEKYAVRCGGAHCHRLGLYDAVLIKDNHLAAIAPEQMSAWLTEAAARARMLAAESGRQLSFFEVEVDTLEQLDRVLAARAQGAAVDIILLDNFPVERLREAIELRERWGASSVLLESSGGVNLQSVRSIAETGVDRISVGAITHQATSVDLGLDAVD